MIWGLKQGIMGYAQQTLSPSLAAMGPNRYLREKDFFSMLAVALGAHLMVVLIASLMPGDKVKDIPVRALSFKIGGQDKIAAYGLSSGIGTTSMTRAPAPAAPAVAAPSAWRAAPVVKPKPVPVKPAKIVSVPREERTTPKENETALKPIPETILPSRPAAEIETAPALPDTAALTTYTPPAPAIAASPQRFIRETGMAPPAGQLASNANTGQGSTTGAVGGEGTEHVMTADTAQTVRERYEQQISLWIQQHKIYPSAAQGKEGKVVIRMRIDRTGYVRYYALEQSSGNAVLDAAAIDMIRRANPVPAVPANYPAGNLIEFLIPIMFRKP